MHQDFADDYDKNSEPADQTQSKFRLIRTPRMNKYQLDCLINYMTMHPKFAREIDLSFYCNIQDNKMWKEISTMVSSHGLERTIEQCINSWSGLKKRAFEKLSTIKKLMRRTGNSSILSCIKFKERDLKILAIWGLSAPKFIEDYETCSLFKYNNELKLSRRKQNKTQRERPRIKDLKSFNGHEDVPECSLKNLAELQDFDFSIFQHFSTDTEFLQLDNIILDNIFDFSEYSQSLELRNSFANSFQYDEKTPVELSRLDDVFMQNGCQKKSLKKIHKTKKSPKVSKAIRNVSKSSKITSEAKDCTCKAFRATVVGNIFREENTEDTVDDEAIWEFLTSDQTNCY
ncbi:hypothetical protein PV328_011307 [Microctonus aethiopoides]|uniref:Uncharacterized protein n=1 Tax=Microctonus aethiopoides TaxID=144406 RepID=A0AA39C527_9HYME|nr:hypothetical protein PV328_011307 [Microctonus aethiopoides]